MMDKKYKILVVPSDRTGVGKFRSIDPHVFLAKHYSDQFDVDIKYLQDFPQDNLENFIKQYDLIHVHKQMDKGCKLLEMMKFLGAKVIIDVDDYWDLGQYHPMAITARAEKWDVPIKAHISMADAVTTTTPIFAKEISKLNKNVFVIPNAVDPTEEQFQCNKTESDKIRFGLICGSSHLHDIELLSGIANKLGGLMDKIQFVLCGFDTNGTRTIYHQDTGQVERRPILPQESVWCDYEKILTDDYKIVSTEHNRFLHTYAKGVDDTDKSEPYMRYWTRDINHYATHYNNIDVLLAPLKECSFNKMKSQLKVIEAGFMHTALIAQDFGAYQLDIKPIIEKGGTINESGNGLLVESSKNHKQWAKYIKTLVEKPELITMMQENLYNTVKDTYSLEAVTKTRVETYLKVLGAEE